MRASSRVRHLSLQQRLTLLLLGALALLLVPLGAFTVREARRASLINLETALLTRLGFYSAVTPGDLVALTALSNEYGGYGFLYLAEESLGDGATDDTGERTAASTDTADTPTDITRVRYTDTGAHTLPPNVLDALGAQTTYNRLHGDELFVAVPLAEGAVGLAVRGGEITALTRRLLLAYSLAAGVLFVLVGLFGAQALRRVLAPLNRMSLEIARRSPDNLEPLPVPAIPEVQPTAERLNQLLRELSQALTRSGQQEQAARRFAAQASHELRTPLTALGGYLEVLKLRPGEPRALSGALREMVRMRALLGALLTLARLEGRAQAAPTPVELRAFVSAELPEVALEVRPGAFPCALADRELLRVALHNLQSNAERYGAQPFAVRLGGGEGYATLEFCDAGPGFPDGLLERVLEPFVHGDIDGEVDSEAGGEIGDTGARSTGLGLAIVRAIMEVHGGEVAADNPPEGGARVRLRFRSSSG